MPPDVETKAVPKLRRQKAHVGIDQIHDSNRKAVVDITQASGNHTEGKRNSGQLIIEKIGHKGSACKCNQHPKVIHQRSVISRLFEFGKPRVQGDSFKLLSERHLPACTSG